MKQLEIPLANNDRLLLVEIPKDAYNINNDLIDHQIDYEFKDESGLIFSDAIIIKKYFGKKLERLGTYTTKTGEIDFEVKEEWVEKIDDLMYKCYIPIPNGMTNCGLFNLQMSFETLLQSETTKAFPYEVNPHGTYDQWCNYLKAYMECNPLFTPLNDKTWQEAQSNVMPEKFVVMLIK